MKKKQNIIFLDFDGVLTCTKTSFIDNDPEHYGYSEEHVQRILDVCNATKSKIILISNWRKFDLDGRYKHNGQWYSNPLPKLMERLGDVCIGTTSPARHISKLDALRNWFFILANVEKINKFVVIDDDEREGFQDSEFKDIFIKTDPKVGFTDSDADKVKELLLA